MEDPKEHSSFTSAQNEGQSEAHDEPHDSTFTIDPKPALGVARGSTPRLFLRPAPAPATAPPPPPALTPPGGFRERRAQSVPVAAEPPKPVPGPIRLTKIQPAIKKQPSAAPNLKEWTVESLAESRVPTEQAILAGLKIGAAQALFLTALESQTIPHFLAMGAVGTPAQVGVWRGLTWNPELVPEIWNYLIASGGVELAPPGEHTNQFSMRNLVRAAFGINPTDWLVLVRCGPAESCTGIVAFVGGGSLITLLGPVVAKISEQPT